MAICSDVLDGGEGRGAAVGGAAAVAATAAYDGVDVGGLACRAVSLSTISINTLASLPRRVDVPRLQKSER